MPPGLEPGAAFAAELDALCYLFAAVRAFVQRQIMAAVVAELASAGRLAAVRAGDGLAFDGAAEHIRLFGCLLDLLNHPAGLCLCNGNVLAGCAFNAHALVLVEVGVADPLTASMAAVEVLLGFILSPYESRFMLFLPFRAHAVESFRQHIAAIAGAPYDIAYSTSEQTSQRSTTASTPLLSIIRLLLHLKPHRTLPDA